MCLLHNFILPEEIWKIQFLCPIPLILLLADILSTAISLRFISEIHVSSIQYILAARLHVTVHLFIPLGKNL